MLVEFAFLGDAAAVDALPPSLEVGLDDVDPLVVVERLVRVEDREDDAALVFDRLASELSDTRLVKECLTRSISKKDDIPRVPFLDTPQELILGVLYHCLGAVLAFGRALLEDVYPAEVLLLEARRVQGIHQYRLGAGIDFGTFPDEHYLLFAHGNSTTRREK